VAVDAAELLAGLGHTLRRLAATPGWVRSSSAASAHSSVSAAGIAVAPTLAPSSSMRCTPRSRKVMAAAREFWPDAGPATPVRQD